MTCFVCYLLATPSLGGTERYTVVWGTNSTKKGGCSVGYDGAIPNQWFNICYVSQIKHHQRPSTYCGRQRLSVDTSHKLLWPAMTINGHSLQPIVGTQCPDRLTIPPVY